ncbi:MAG: TetR/AcrR family transcriptional regulator, partial [Actinomycetota bacterium]
MVDREGLDGLSMRTLAKDLGTGAASLYWHVRNREELLHLMIDAVCAEIELPEPDASRWEEQLK